MPMRALMADLCPSIPAKFLERLTHFVHHEKTSVHLAEGGKAAASDHES